MRAKLHACPRAVDGDSVLGLQMKPRIICVVVLMDSSTHVILAFRPIYTPTVEEPLVPSRDCG